MDLINRITASVLLAVPLIVSSNTFAAANTAKPVADKPSVHFGGTLGFGFVGLQNKNVLTFTDSFRPSFSAAASHKLFGMDTTLFTSFAVKGSLSANSPYSFTSESMDFDSSGNDTLKLSSLGLISKSKFGSIEAGHFETRSAAVLANNFSPVSQTPGLMLNDYRFFQPNNNLLPVAMMMGSFVAQGKASHIGFVSNPIMGATIGVEYVPVDFKNVYAESTVKKDSSTLSASKHGSMSGVKYDVRAAYSTRLTPAPFLPMQRSGVVVEPFDQAFKANQTSVSVAVEKGGLTGSLAYAVRKHDNAITSNTVSSDVKPKALDVTVGYSKPLAGGLFAGRLGYTSSKHAGVGLAFASTAATMSELTANKSHVVSVGTSYTYKASETALYVNKMKNISTVIDSNDSTTNQDSSFTSFQLGTKVTI